MTSGNQSEMVASRGCGARSIGNEKCVTCNGILRVQRRGKGTTHVPRVTVFEVSRGGRFGKKKSVSHMKDFVAPRGKTQGERTCVACNGVIPTQNTAKQSKANKSKAKQSRAKQGKAKQSEAEQNKAQQRKAKQSKAEQSKAKQSKAKQNKAKRSKAKQSAAQQSKA